MSTEMVIDTVSHQSTEDIAATVLLASMSLKEDPKVSPEQREEAELRGMGIADRMLCQAYLCALIPPPGTRGGGAGRRYLRLHVSCPQCSLHNSGEMTAGNRGARG